MNLFDLLLDLAYTGVILLNPGVIILNPGVRAPGPLSFLGADNGNHSASLAPATNEH